MSFYLPWLEALELSNWMNQDDERFLLSWALTHASRLRTLLLRTSGQEEGFLPRLLTICLTSLVCWY